MKLLLRAVAGITLWLFGMTLAFVSVRNFFDGSGFWMALGHLGQGAAATLLGFALMPYTPIREFLENTFDSKR